MAVLVKHVRRNLAPYLRSLMGAWLLSQCDTYPTVASAAISAFSDAFPPVKQTDAFVFCKENCLEVSATKFNLQWMCFILITFFVSGINRLMCNNHFSIICLVYLSLTLLRIHVQHST